MGLGGWGQLATLEHAILGHLRRPPAGFEAASRLHFAFRREAILATARRWQREGRAQRELGGTAAGGGGGVGGLSAAFGVGGGGGASADFAPRMDGLIEAFERELPLAAVVTALGDEERGGAGSPAARGGGGEPA